MSGEGSEVPTEFTTEDTVLFVVSESFRCASVRGLGDLIKQRPKALNCAAYAMIGGVIPRRREVIEHAIQLGWDPDKKFPGLCPIRHPGGCFSAVEYCAIRRDSLLLDLLLEKGFRSRHKDLSLHDLAVLGKSEEDVMMLNKIWECFKVLDKHAVPFVNGIKGAGMTPSTKKILRWLETEGGRRLFDMYQIDLSELKPLSLSISDYRTTRRMAVDFVGLRYAYQETEYKLALGTNVDLQVSPSVTLNLTLTAIVTVEKTARPTTEEILKLVELDIDPSILRGTYFTSAYVHVFQPSELLSKCVR